MTVTDCMGVQITYARLKNSGPTDDIVRNDLFAAEAAEHVGRPGLLRAGTH